MALFRVAAVADYSLQRETVMAGRGIVFAAFGSVRCRVSWEWIVIYE